MSQLGRRNSFYRPPGAGARNLSERIALIFNPKAGGGSAERTRASLEEATDRAFANWSLRASEGPGHASVLAAEAVDQGFDIVAAVGGDGTCHEVVNGLAPGGRPRRRRVIFTTIPMGTGSDLSRSLELGGRLQRSLWLAATGITLPTDLGRLTWEGADGPHTRVFANSAGFGANGDVVARANASSKRLGGRGTYMVAALQVSMRQPAHDVALRWTEGGEERSWEGRVMAVFVANGSHCGGGMRMAPMGCMHDGLLDVVVLPPLGGAQQLRHLRRLYDGRAHEVPGAFRIRTQRLEARTRRNHRLSVELDGELPGVLPAAFEAVPRALHMRGGWQLNPLVSAGPSQTTS